MLAQSSSLAVVGSITIIVYLMTNIATKVLRSTLMLILLSSPLELAAESQSTNCHETETCFPNAVYPFGKRLVKASTARYRYYGFLVFDSVLYAESPQVVRSDFLGRAPCALRLCYHRSLSADEFRQSAIETLALNPEKPAEKLLPRINLLHAKYQQVGEGDCYQLSFNPGSGTELSLNDTPIVTVPGDDFARAYLGIWLSKYSFSETLTEKLTTPLTQQN